MKKILTTAFVFALVIFFITPCNTLASGADTLDVYASGPTLDTIIRGDTTSSGAQAHSVYKLVSLDTTYIFDATITCKSSVTFLGVLDPTTGRPPCIQPDIVGGAIPGVLFTFTGNGTSYTLKNLYLLGIAIDNTVNYGSGQAVQLTADSIRFTADNVVFEQWSQFAIGYAGSWDKIYISNCKYRNSTTPPNQWYVGELLRNENYLGAFPTDSIVIKNNTILCIGAYGTAATGGIVNYYEFSHNSVVNTFKNPFFLDRMVNAKFDNNLFYNAYAGGQNKTEFAGWDSFTANTGPSLFTFGWLDSLTAARLLGHASTGTGDPAAELLRKVEVKNNAYFWSSGLTSFYTSWNDTAHVDSVYLTALMNDTTLYMFNNPTLWPGFVSSGNQNVDPGFGASIDNVLSPGSAPNDVGLLNWFTAVRTGAGTTELWGYQLQQVDFSSGNWIPAWPLPESTDMKYSNASLKIGGTDGGPVGDPNWFGPITAVDNNPMNVPTQFKLNEAYPNPFNPSTNIKFSLAQSGLVSLNIYNITGQLVKTILDNVDKPQGNYEYQINMDNFSSGVYFYILRQGNQMVTKKMILLK